MPNCRQNVRWSERDSLKSSILNLSTLAEPILNCYIVVHAQVNGIDVSKSSHEEAIGVFQSATEPIMVQVLRRAPATKPSESISVKVKFH